MRETYSAQYDAPCIVAAKTDTASKVVERCRYIGAYLDLGEGEEFIVELRPDIGPELWTEEALQNSLAP